ncbi:MAG: rhombosortase [Burkholderiaceae bacterium]
MRAFKMSPAERVAVGLALALLVLHALAPGESLEYQRHRLALEPWRALTGHLVHINWPHTLVNAAALWVVARLYAEDLGWRRQLVALVASALAISGALAFAYPSIEWYRGLSGALHGLFFAGATTWLLSERPRTFSRLWMPAALLVGGWIKVVLEQPGGATTPHAAWLGAAIVPQAHFVGAVCGTALGALFAATNARAAEQRRQQ